jgi:HAD superfamily hydrolase (TIGR01509 family)
VASPQFVFLDFDGTLVNSETVRLHAESQLLQSLSVDLNLLPAHDALEALSIAEFAALIGQLVGHEEDWESILRDTYEEAWSSHLRAHEGVYEFVTGLESRRLLVTDTPRHWLIKKLAWAGLPGEWANRAVTGDQVASRKPDPQVYLTALTIVGASAREVVAIEDSVAGVEAARAAGLKVFGFAGGLATLEELVAAGATPLESWSDAESLIDL